MGCTCSRDQAVLSTAAADRGKKLKKKNDAAAPKARAPLDVKTDGADTNNKPSEGGDEEDQTSPFSFVVSPGVLTTAVHDGTKNARAFMKEGAHHLQNVYATPLSMFGSGPLPSHPKSPEEIQFMNQHLRENYLFESLPHEDMVALIAAFEKIEITAEQVAKDPECAVLIREGDTVTRSTAFFYLLYRGKCCYTVDEKVVGVAKPGDSFGELALLFDCPRAATVLALLGDKDSAAAMKGSATATASLSSTTATFTSSALSAENEHGTTDNVVLFRVHQRSFRRILQQADQSADNAKMKLLDKVSFMKEVSQQQKGKLAAVMKPLPFKKGEYIFRKGEEKCSWYLIERGSVLCANISLPDEETHEDSGSRHIYEDVLQSEGEYFGDRSIMTGQPTAADFIAQTDCIIFAIDRETFLEVLGDLEDLIHRSRDQYKLKAISVIVDTTQKDERMVSFLASRIGDIKGKVKITSTSEAYPTETIGEDGYFGDDQLMADKIGRTKFLSRYTAIAVTDCVFGVLKLDSCRRIVNTQRMGYPQNIDLDSLRVAHGDLSLSLDKLKLHTILGAGTFGQVWLVSRVASDGKLRAYALKVQSKYELCESGQAKGVVREKNIMAQFNNPFLATLVVTFQDKDCVYMVMNLVQGGELHSVMHTPDSDVLTEKVARFYLACIAEGLAYMHRMGFVYRDLKPENVLIDNRGYAVIIDFGFAKKIISKTYTMCGTPLYLPAEIILNRGHSFSADHWSLGIVMFEMLVGSTPFYKPGMSKSDLFRAIVQAKLPPPTGVSPEALSLISGLLKRDPAKRLGSLAGGEADIIEHPWFQRDGFDTDMLFLQQMKAPFVPRIKNPLDDENFGDWSHVEDKLKKHYPKLTSEQSKIFSSF